MTTTKKASSPRKFAKAEPEEASAPPASRRIEREYVYHLSEGISLTHRQMCWVRDMIENHMQKGENAEHLELTLVCKDDGYLYDEDGRRQQCIGTAVPKTLHYIVSSPTASRTAHIYYEQFLQLEEFYHGE